MWPSVDYQRRWHSTQPEGVLLRAQSGSSDDKGRAHGGGGEVGCELVIACGDASPILETAEHARDEIVSAIGGLVETMMSLAGRIVRDDRNRAAFEKKATQTIAVVGGVGGPAATWRNSAVSAVATRTSPRWPGVTSIAIGRPRASTMAWIFVVRPPRLMPIAWFCSPLMDGPPLLLSWQGAIRTKGSFHGYRGSRH